jgi:formylmethanofuran dehydrogenase subunit B
VQAWVKSLPRDAQAALAIIPTVVFSITFGIAGAVSVVMVVYKILGIGGE